MARRKRPRFELSEEARRLVLDPAREWELVQLQDGDAAQKMVPGIKARPPEVPLQEAPEPELPAGPEQEELFRAS